MTKKTKDESIEKFIDDHIKWMKDMMLKSGELSPTMAILTKNNDTEEIGIVIAPIIGDFDDASKDILVKKIVPEVFKEIKNMDCTPICFSFSFEAYIRKVKTEDLTANGVPENWKDIEKEEVLMLMFESEHSSKNFVFSMKRVGKAINEDGRMIDQIDLQDYDMGSSDVNNMSGRFANLFKQYGL